MSGEYPITNPQPESARARALHRFAVGGAWFFLVTSLVLVAWVVGVKWSDPSGLTTLYQTTVDDETTRAWGLAYGGVPGLLLAIAQLLIVFSAAVASSLLGRPWLAIAHGVLIAWSALWMLNLSYLASLDHEIDSFAQAGLLTVLCGCTVYRALSRPRRLPEGASPPHEAEGSKGLTAEHIASSEKLRDVTPALGLRKWMPLPTIRRLVAKLSGSAEKARPIGGTVRARLAGAVRRVRRYLGRHGVIPDPDRTSASRSMPR